MVHEAVLPRFKPFSTWLRMAEGPNRAALAVSKRGLSRGDSLETPGGPFSPKKKKKELRSRFYEPFEGTEVAFLRLFS